MEEILYALYKITDFGSGKIFEGEIPCPIFLKILQKEGTFFEDACFTKNIICLVLINT